MKKLIAITQRIIPSDKGGADRDGLEEDYVTYYEQFGVQLMPVPNVLSNVSGYLSRFELDGIILSGGNDVSPACYGGKLEPGVKYAEARDKTDKAMLEYAIKKKLPVLGECRGAQFLNAYFGGKLKRVPDHIGRHSVELFDKQALKIVPSGNVEVNSYHSWGFTDKELSGKFNVFAKAPDGVIEGICHKKLPLVGILWHPEREAVGAPAVNLNAKLVKSFLSRSWFWK